MKERAGRLLIEVKDNYPSRWAAIEAITSKIGCSSKTLRAWDNKHAVLATPEAVQAQDALERIKILERENRELQRSNEILRKAVAFFAQAELDRPYKR
ncbi:hypothetical protein [Suttonella ornithocola]|uniref:hypothetical protein n=1 Tax=Suttonella ornithocola TaxID=279832 RepID=UPI000933CE2A|nr:hypothetical protein [Suttonella ornithocola]